MGRRAPGRGAEGRSRLASALPLMRDARDEPRALPELAIVPVHLRLRDLDRVPVILGFEPFAGRDLIDPVQAIKPVVHHAQNPVFLTAKRPFRGPNEARAIWFPAPFAFTPPRKVEGEWAEPRVLPLPPLRDFRSFRSLEWQPPFIDQLKAQNRCCRTAISQPNFVVLTFARHSKWKGRVCSSNSGCLTGPTGFWARRRTNSGGAISLPHFAQGLPSTSLLSSR